MKGRVFGKFTRKKSIGEAGFFRRAPWCEAIGEAFAPVAVIAIADLDQTCFRRGAQLRIEPAKGDPDRLGNSTLGGVWCQVELAQKAKPEVFVVISRDRSRMEGHGKCDSRFVHA